MTSTATATDEPRAASSAGPENVVIDDGQKEKSPVSGEPPAASSEDAPEHVGIVFKKVGCFKGYGIIHGHCFVVDVRSSSAVFNVPAILVQPGVTKEKKEFQR
uniref:Uncharacterized protein n=1 Tax=Panagrolaimus superbus TaxID=310955 RepID=A0A914ZBU5_9BILA